VGSNAKRLDEQRQQRLIDHGQIPGHIAIIMDGNGRWARQKGYPRIAGHREGVESVKDIVEAAAQIGVKYLTLYTFSTENWKRPKDEVFTLMRLLVKTLRAELNRLNLENIRISTIGEFSSLPEKVQAEFNDAITKTRNNTKMHLIIALSYGSRWEILEAVKKLAEDISTGAVQKNEISYEVFGKYLTTAGIPDPDLVIRTSGEFGVSNFLLWQIAYSEFYVTDIFWPDFRRESLYEAIKNFQHRERRFGKISS
jgi:undecaprenyl diphosphate synthase